MASKLTFPRQVAVLEDRLAKSGSTESRVLSVPKLLFPEYGLTMYQLRDELNSVRSALDNATNSKRSLEVQAAAQAETCERLSQANDQLSARALALADEAEREKRALQRRLQDELAVLRKQLDEAQEDADEQKTRGQSQRIQLLDEVSGPRVLCGDDWARSMRLMTGVGVADEFPSGRGGGLEKAVALRAADRAVSWREPHFDTAGRASAAKFLRLEYFWTISCDHHIRCGYLTMQDNARPVCIFAV